MSDDACELPSGALLDQLPPARPIIHRATRELGTGLFLAALYGLPALGLAVGAVLTALVDFPGVGIRLLAAFELAIALGLGWLAATLVREALADRRFNRRQVTVRFGLEAIEVRSTEGVEPVALTEARTHPLLRSLRIDSRIFLIVQVRASCQRLAADDPRRVALETLALAVFDPVSFPEDTSRAPPLYVAVVDRRAVIAHDPADLADLAGAPRWRVATYWDAEAQAFLPRLEPAALRAL